MEVVRVWADTEKFANIHNYSQLFTITDINNSN